MCWEERLAVVVFGGWRGVVRGFLNSSSVGFFVREGVINNFLFVILFFLVWFGLG